MKFNNFTTSKSMNKKLEKYFEKIVNVIIKEIKVRSIILIGGFGRGEGSFYRGEPFNDIDLYIVTDKKVDEKRLDNIGKRASFAIGKGGEEFIEHSLEEFDRKKFFHVDVRCLEYSRLGKMLKTTRTFEMKYGSAVIYGEDVRNKIKISEKELPISEGFRHMINKSCHLLLGMDSRRYAGKFKKDEREQTTYWAIKTILGCCEAFLLSANRFAPTYRKRNELFRQIYGKKFPELAKKIDFATRFKLKLDFQKTNVLKVWKDARNVLEFTLRYLAKKHLNIKAKNRIELVREINKKLPYSYFAPYLPLGKIAFPAQYFLNILYFKRTGYWKSLLSWKDVGIRILAPAFLLLFAIEDKSLLKQARNYLEYIAPVKGGSFEELRKSLLYAYERYFLQKLI